MCMICVLSSQLATLKEVKTMLEIEGLRDSDTYQSTLDEIEAVNQELIEKGEVLKNTMKDVLTESLQSEPLFYPYYNDPKKGEEN